MLKFFNILSLILISAGSCSDIDRASEIEEANKNKVIHFVAAIWNEKDLTQVETFYADSFTRKVNNIETTSDKKELLANIQVYFTAFPDLKFNINKIIPYHNKVILNWTITGTNTGMFGEFPATGKKIRVSGVTQIDFDEEGKFVNEEAFFNELSLLQQLGYSLKPPDFD
jgi:steroid delta-isomerase-like uncharacterized protein